MSERKLLELNLAVKVASAGFAVRSCEMEACKLTRNPSSRNSLVICR